MTTPDSTRSVLSGARCAYLLSNANGGYMVMVDGAGSGFSRWRGLAVARWREDPTCDGFGHYVLLRDRTAHAVWSASVQPFGAAADACTVRRASGRVEFVRHDGPLKTALHIAVARHADAEVRRVTVSNHGNSARDIDLTSYAELVLGSQAADATHPAFSKMFVQTEWVEKPGVLLATRRRRGPDEPVVWAAHFALADAPGEDAPEYETDRARFLGRGRVLRDAIAMERATRLSNTVGTVLDPVSSLRRRVQVAPGSSAQVAFWTLLAGSREEALAGCESLATMDACERAFAEAADDELAECARLDVGADQAERFQRLAAPLLIADAAWRSPPGALSAGAGGAPVLWPRAISGDRPILLAHVGNEADLAVVDELLLAQRYWRAKRLGIDVVFLNVADGDASRRLQAALDTRVATQHADPTAKLAATRADSFAIDNAQITDALRDGLTTVARLVIDGSTGALLPRARHDANATTPSSETALAGHAARSATANAGPRPLENATHPFDVAVTAPLEFDNGTGGFARGGREYVVCLTDRRCTPMPWINVIANPSFGFLVCAEGGGYTWSRNSQQNPLTPWPNDPVSDQPHEVLYLRDEESGDVWSACASPIRVSATTYLAHHGKGYSRFTHGAYGIEVELLQCVPTEGSIKLSRLRLRNRSGRTRRLSITAYVEWALAPNGAASAPFVVTCVDAATGALFARNAWRAEFGERVAFIDLGGAQTSASGDRTGFLGRYGSVDQPAALRTSAPLSGRVGAGLDPCGALQTCAELQPDAGCEVVFMLGDASSAEEAQKSIETFRAADLDAVLRDAEARWNDVLDAVAVRTPDRAMDILLNDWLLYQVLACRVWGRTAYYQASGAYGFRDQLQDVMALCVAKPAVAREQLLRAAARQFPEGDVQHWWQPPSGQGIRTRMTDDRVWLPYVAAHYLEVTADRGLLDAPVPFIEGAVLKDGEIDAFFQPTVGDVPASFYEHCARAIDASLSLGAHRLPLFGTGDWNDGMNRVGIDGRGESVWLGWFLVATIDAFAPVASARDDEARATRWREFAAALRAALETAGWDGAQGEWYRRGYYDDGSPLGSRDSDECRIDAIAQSWSVIAGASDAAHAERAMVAVSELLISRDERIACLFTPPFDHTARDPGYIKGYPPGIRENGGQYTHGAIWSVFAFAMLGQGDAAGELFAMLNPIRHGSTPADVERYRVEPYAACADVYSVAPHAGRGGWTWYTGSAGWLYRAGLEAILGFRLCGDTLTIDPCIPAAWRDYAITYRRTGPGNATTRYDIGVDNSHGVSRGVTHAELDGIAAEVTDGIARIPLCDDARVHRVRIVLG